MSSIIVNLQCLPESFQFEPKWIALSTESRILLGSDTGETVVDQRTATTSNGFFPPMMPTSRGGDPIMPLALSASHAEMWVKDNKVMLRDLDAPFGTFVNSVKLAGEMALNSGDIITLGYQLPRNNKTPAHITVDHLKPIIAKVTISVASQS
ncbi:hypothetical protein AX14_001005 [Amanita brunnescens Koide BX004]|nr:hypothetical protein AX14_001005 [Amanita brunnescens Koide BX004]